ncbi:MAG: aminodeoxychorismate/anthranilate synthase component II [Campylobacteraceae bacterium]|jgi:anthranilate synthase component 2|nr:aminodeoxychorismate/anthranilate synthase component II [Campylobacteraceae bacterium]
MILLIDNYDSFSYNLYQLIGEMDSNIKVVRNDELSIQDIETLKPKSIILSPGPGRPENAGICMDTVKYFAPKIPILGVCLGHQAICEVFGTPVIYAKSLMHGKQSCVTIDTNNKIFKSLPDKILVARYHSLAADSLKIPPVLQIIGHTQDGEIMAVKHKEYETYGVQFHPESILTPQGSKIVENFLNI